MTQAAPSKAQRFLESAGAAVVIAGFVFLVRFFVVNRYLPAPFVFDTNDTFMDWFNTAYWAHNPGAYTVWGSIYPPLSFVITGLFGDPRCYATSSFDARDCDLIGIATILVTFVAAIVLTGIAFYRNDRATAPMRTVAVAVGGPMLFSLERGNLIMMGYVGFVLLYGGFARSKSAVALTAGFLVNMKVYLVLPILTFAIKRRWRILELCGLASVAIYLASLAIVGAGTPLELATNVQIWLNSFAISVWDQVVYSTSYSPYLLFDVLQYPIRDFVDQKTVDLAKTAIEYEIVVSRGVALLCLAGAWFYPKAVSLTRLVFFILMQSFLVQNPGGYAITFIVFLVFMERRFNLATGLALVCCYVISIPMDYSLATILDVDRVSWISGRMVHVQYVLTIGALLRPLLFVIMLWALAVDSLIDIHRAVKSGPPVLGLGSRPWGSRPAALTGAAVA